MYKITNSKENSNLIVNNKTLKYGDSMNIDEETLERIKPLIDNGDIVIEKKKVKRIEISRPTMRTDEMIEIDNGLIEVFFKFHTNISLSENELKNLVWFYKNVSPVSSLSENIKSDLDEVKDNEELIEVLINHIYPELIKNFLSN